MIDSVLEYQKRRVYGDEIPLADLNEPRYREAIENGYDGVFQFETENAENNYQHYSNIADDSKLQMDEIIKELEERIKQLISIVKGNDVRIQK